LICFVFQPKGLPFVFCFFEIVVHRKNRKLKLRINAVQITTNTPTGSVSAHC